MLAGHHPALTWELILPGKLKNKEGKINSFIALLLESLFIDFMDFHKSSFKLADLNFSVRGSKKLGKRYCCISLTFNGNLAFPLMMNPSSIPS